jgi:cystathionine beta-lyase
MTYDFDTVISRTGTASSKWDMLEELFGYPDVLPMWVADMDFSSPPEVVKALKQRAEHGVFGYTFRPPSYYDAIIDWQKRRHGWSVPREWIVGVPGVVTAMSLLIKMLTEPHDRIMIQVPVYHPFYQIISQNGRTIVRNPLKLAGEHYEMDFAEMERQIISEKVKMLLLCNPHNPVGRVWTRDELTALGQLCLKHGVTVISDEIHGDIIFRGHRHIPFASLADEFAAIAVTCAAPSKTFNIAGLNSAYAVIANPAWRDKLSRRLKTLALDMENCFAQVAVEACYRHGEAWLNELLVYLEENVGMMSEFLAQELPEIKMIRPEGTYLAWLDCREISSDPSVWKEIMYSRARVAFHNGSIFGREGAGFLRVNFGCPRSLLSEGLERFARAVREYRQSFSQK